MSIYPNPATNEFKVESTKYEVLSIKMYDVLGREILKQVQNDQRATVDISGYAKGLYFVEVQTTKGVVRRKLIKE